MVCECGKDEIAWAILEFCGDEDYPYLWWFLCDVCALAQPGTVFTIAEYEAMKQKGKA